MSGPGRPTLCKPEHAGRARALCARGAANPDRAGHRERILWVRQQNGRWKGRKGRKPRILGKQGPFQCWREAAETGGNWRKPPAETLELAFHLRKLRKLRKPAGRWTSAYGYDGYWHTR
jgi:hypothetical protein